LAGLGSIPHLEVFAFLWLPGAFLAAFVFPEGIHSDFGFTYIILAALLDVLLYFALIYLSLVSLEKKKATRQQTSAEGPTSDQPTSKA
jgi:hypothetical protein